MLVVLSVWCKQIRKREEGKCDYNFAYLHLESTLHVACSVSLSVCVCLCVRERNNYTSLHDNNLLVADITLHRNKLHYLFLPF